MKIDVSYHSGLREEKVVEPCERCEFPGGMAFVHDIRNGLPKEFAACDVIYAELPWKVGYREFNERAGVKAGSFESFYYLLSDVIRSEERPFYMTCGEAGMSYLPVPHDSIKIKLYGNPAMLICFNAFCPVVTRKRLSNQEIIAWLATQYQCVGDFCCGYGVTGRTFVQAGKQCVLTDYNAKCIGEIKQTAGLWTATNTKA